MIRGTVGADQRALVTIEAFDGEGRLQPVEAVLDTGFTGDLTLPADDIRRLGLRPAGQRTFELANGATFDFDVYLGSVSWHGRASDVLVLEADGAPLLGMAMLWGSRVTFDAASGGAVTIDELDPVP